jgi:hypothetical protein
MGSWLNIFKSGIGRTAPDYQSMSSRRAALAAWLKQHNSATLFEHLVRKKGKLQQRIAV